MIIVLLTMMIMVNSGITIAYIFYILKEPKSITYRKDVIPEGKCLLQNKRGQNMYANNEVKL